MVFFCRKKSLLRNSPIVGFFETTLYSFTEHNRGKGSTDDVPLNKRINNNNDKHVNGTFTSVDFKASITGLKFIDGE